MKNPIDKLIEDLNQMCGIDLLSAPTTQNIVASAKAYQKKYNTVIYTTVADRSYTAGRYFGKK